MPAYNDFSSFLRKYFDGKVQKISLNAGFTCPNRDGVKAKEAVLIVIIRLLIRNIAKLKNQIGRASCRERV